MTSTNETAAPSRGHETATRALRLLLAAATGLLPLAVTSCEDDDVDYVSTTSVPLYDTYAYDYYYPADLAYSGAYWAYPWDYSGLYYYDKVQTNRSGLAAGQGLTLVGAALRDLARGQMICPGNATVTPKTAAPACSGGSQSSVRTGVTVTFNDCQLVAGGGTVSGTVDVQSQHASAQQACSANTELSLGWTTTVTNLVYTAPDGQKVVIPNHTSTGSTKFNFGSAPSTLSIMTTGRLQLYSASGGLVSDRNHDGTRTYSWSGAGEGYTMDGALTVNDASGDAVAMLNASGLLRDGSCCRPVGGTLMVNRTSGPNQGSHTWAFGSTCGNVTRDGTAVTMPACP